LPMGTARSTLRAALRARRAAIAPAQRRRAAQLAARNADRALHLAAGVRVALYAALPSELDSAPLIGLAVERGCRVYLPRIDRRRASHAMRFVEMRGPLGLNRLGIEEPQGSAVIGARWLDVVFLPLVGFDRSGVRLGTGGGFYDRAFEFRRWRATWHAPRLVGLGYACQEVEHIAAAPHDVRLDAIVTEEGVVRCATG
jgi:5-formyltetrahydrofolate cyclo-ligase